MDAVVELLPLMLLILREVRGGTPPMLPSMPCSVCRTCEGTIVFEVCL